MAHLRTGHSHEDIDQGFGALGTFIVRRAKTVETPEKFQEIIQRYCEAAVRPYEKDRLTFMIDRHRDWRPVLES